ncbi:hypothetical protein Cgig2_018435 [Carnegiea gigantea]|uniref:Aminotransferase class I/classII domain-containing protein n=1 Tax=Carnegiea gigantea TaxID=171969 RepID=A0A9Q1K6C0_9CARY|nr:hypothetical protein Cgig2_018435 [Carnegiea gigantea]
MWASCPQVLDIVREIWKQPVQGTPMFELTRKLKAIKLPLKALNKSQSIQVRVLEALATSSNSVAAAFVAEKESWRRKAIWKRVQDFRSLTGIPIPSHIVSVIVGNEEKALLASRHLLKSGFYVTAIRPPTVAPNSCRLRVTLTAAHTRNDVKKLAAALSHCISFQDVYINTSLLQAKL